MLSIQQCRCSIAAAEPPFIKVKLVDAVAASKPHGQHDELFPDLPTRSTPVSTRHRGPSWEKIHESREHVHLRRRVPSILAQV